MDREIAPKTATKAFPLTEFLLALIRMTPEQRHRANAEKAAQRYNLPVAWCQWYIAHWKTVNN